MILCDVNVLLHAMVEASPHHELCRRELEAARRGSPGLAWSDIVLAAVLRIGTNARVYRPTPEPEDVFAFVDALRTDSSGRRVEPGERHWTVFRDLVLSTGVRGSETTDAWLAALAIEQGCEWWTTDADFGRFPGLRWRNLLA